MVKRLPVFVAAIRLIVYAILAIVITTRLEVDAADGETVLMFTVAIAAVLELIGTAITEFGGDWGEWFHVVAFLLVAAIEIAIIAGATFAIKFEEGSGGFVLRAGFQPTAYTFAAIGIFVGLASMVVVMVGWCS